MSILQNSDYKDKINYIIALIKDPGVPNNGKFKDLLYSMFSVEFDEQSMSKAITNIMYSTSNISVSFSGIGSIGDLLGSIAVQAVSALIPRGGKTTRRRQKRMIKVKTKRRIRKSRKKNTKVAWSSLR